MSLETLVVEVPIFQEADLVALERRCERVIAALTTLGTETSHLRASARRILRIVQEARESFGGEGEAAPSRPRLRVVGPSEFPRRRKR